MSLVATTTLRGCCPYKPAAAAAATAHMCAALISLLDHHVTLLCHPRMALQGDYRYFWWSFPTTILNSNPGWQCPADRYLNMDQQNFTVPAPLCDASTTLTDAKGVIASHKQATSPDELENYKPHSQCEWVLPTLAVGGKVGLLWIVQPSSRQSGCSHPQLVHCTATSHNTCSVLKCR